MKRLKNIFKILGDFIQEDKVSSVILLILIILVFILLIFGPYLNSLNDDLFAGIFACIISAIYISILFYWIYKGKGW